MISLIESEDEVPGNSERLLSDLKESAVVDEGRSAEEPAKPKVRTLEINDEELPENLRGKTVADYVRMIQESQSTIGRMANDLGTQRKLTDRLLDLKRENDLQQHTPPAPKVSGTELLDNPTEAIEQVVKAVIARQEQETVQRVQQLEGTVAAQAFYSRHSDWQQISADPEFHSFLQSTPYRQRVAADAARGDWGAADELVTEYKDRRSLRAAAVTKSKEEKEKGNLEAANKASLESSSAPGARKGGKILRRIDLLKLQMEQPEVYYDEETQRTIMRAYAEGRVK